jgi:hypothetical protein
LLFKVSLKRPGTRRYDPRAVGEWVEPVVLPREPFFRVEEDGTIPFGVTDKVICNWKTDADCVQGEIIGVTRCP